MGGSFGRIFKVGGQAVNAGIQAFYNVDYLGTRVDGDGGGDFLVAGPD